MGANENALISKTSCFLHHVSLIPKRFATLAENDLSIDLSLIFSSDKVDVKCFAWGGASSKGRKDMNLEVICFIGMVNVFLRLKSTIYKQRFAHYFYLYRVNAILDEYVLKLATDEIISMIILYWFCLVLNYILSVIVDVFTCLQVRCNKDDVQYLLSVFTLQVNCFLG